MAVTYSTETAQPPFESRNAISLLLTLTAFCIIATASENVYAHMVHRLALEPTADAETTATTALVRKITMLGPPPSGLSAEEFDKALANAVATWNSVICSNTQLEVVASGHLQGDDEHIVIAVDAPEDPCLPSGFIGFTTHSCPTYDGRFTILLNDKEFEWHAAPTPFHSGSPPRVDTQSVLTHELGHSLGLPHVFDDPHATMAPSYLRDGGQRTLSAADKLALCGRYPSGQSECLSGSECTSRQCVVESETRGVCEEVRGSLGSYCGLELLHCDELCHISSPPTGTGYCSRRCDEDSDCLCEGCKASYRCENETAFGHGVCLLDSSASDAGCAVSDHKNSPAGRDWIPIGLIALLISIVVRRPSHRASSGRTRNLTDNFPR
jgi:hypothetical protein